MNSKRKHWLRYSEELTVTPKQPAGLFGRCVAHLEGTALWETWLIQRCKGDGCVFHCAISGIHTPFRSPWKAAKSSIKTFHVSSSPESVCSVTVWNRWWLPAVLRAHCGLVLWERRPEERTWAAGISPAVLWLLGRPEAVGHHDVPRPGWGKELRVWSLGREDPQRRKWQSTLVILLGESRGQRSLVGYCPQVTKSQKRLSERAHWVLWVYILMTLTWSLPQFKVMRDSK